MTAIMTYIGVYWVHFVLSIKQLLIDTAADCRFRKLYGICLPKYNESIQFRL